MFTRYERRVSRRGHSPLIDPELFRYRGAIGGLLVAWAFFAGTAFTFVLSVHLQSGIGFSPLRTALTLIPFTVGVGAGSGIAPRLMPRGRTVVIIGSLTMATGMALVTVAVGHYGVHLHPWQLIPGLVISGFGMAMVAGTLIAIVLRPDGARPPSRAH
jgi:MFS family permease